MRPLPARVLLAVIATAALAAAAVAPKPIFFLVGVGAVGLLVTSLSTSRRPLTRALQQFDTRVVHVRLWGSPPPGCRGVLTVTAVNAIGAGVHVFFSLDDGASMHLKIAQPKDPEFGSGSVIIANARYVQWNGRKIPREDTATAVSIALPDALVTERHPVPRMNPALLKPEKRPPS